MNDHRSLAAASMFEGDDAIWWMTGGENFDFETKSTELYSVANNNFSLGVDLPQRLAYHNLVNVNNTHMVLLGGEDDIDDVYIFDR